MRLDKLLTTAGLTRAQAKRAVAEGRARVNGEAVRDAGLRVDGKQVPVSYTHLERVIGHTGTERRSRLLREAAVGNIGQWAKA